jgi:hypothetical protein
LIRQARIAAFEFTDALLGDFSAVKDKVRKVSRALTMIRVPATKSLESTVAKLAAGGAEIIHIVADYRGMEMNGAANTDRRLLKDIIRAVHGRLVEDCIRDEVTIIASGGIAMAEHVPKAMICGADLTAVDLALLIAIGARLYEEPEKILVFPDGLEKVPVLTVQQRIVNLMGAWHSQLLEVMGAMGIREARRLRGETGRAIFFDEIDQDTFGKLFNIRETKSR